MYIQLGTVERDAILYVNHTKYGKENYRILASLSLK